MHRFHRHAAFASCSHQRSLRRLHLHHTARRASHVLAGVACSRLLGRIWHLWGRHSTPRCCRCSQCTPSPPHSAPPSPRPPYFSRASADVDSSSRRRLRRPPSASSPASCRPVRRRRLEALVAVGGAASAAYFWAHVLSDTNPPRWSSSRSRALEVCGGGHSYDRSRRALSFKESLETFQPNPTHNPNLYPCPSLLLEAEDRGLLRLGQA